MKCRIIRSVEPDRVKSHVPTQFKDLIPFTDLGRKPVTILLFPLDTRDVVHSRHIRQAFAKIDGTSDTVIALAGMFTEDSTQELSLRGARQFSLKEFHWTDRSHDDIKVLVGAAVKRPNP